MFPIILTAVLIPLSSLGGRSNPQRLTESTPLVHCTGAMSNRHVPTGDTSFISLNAVRGQGMQVIPCGGRLTRCRPTHAMAQRSYLGHMLAVMQPSALPLLLQPFYSIFAVLLACLQILCCISPRLLPFPSYENCF